MKRPCFCPLLIAAAAAFVVFFLFSATPAVAVIEADFYVPTDYELIQEAIDVAAVDGGTVAVEPGTYQETITMKDGVNLIGVETARTFLDGNGSGPIITVGDGINCFISNFTFTNASVGILYANNSAAAVIAIENNVFVVGPTGTAIAITAQNAANAINSTILNNTFYNNGTAVSRDADISIVNNIFDSNLTAISDSSFADSLTEYNLFSANTITTGPMGSNPVSGDPLFVNPAKHDFHLQEGSPCIDAGDVGTFGQSDIDLTDIDIGAYGGQFADPTPFPVAGLTVSSTTTTSISLSWLPNLSYLVTNSTNTLGGYMLYYGYAPGDYTGTDADAGLSPSPIFVSNNSTTFTLANLGPSAPILDPLVPGDSQLVLSWTAVANATGYKVHYGISSPAENTLDAGNVTSYRLMGLTNGQLYSAAVSAYTTTTPLYYINVAAVDSTADANKSAFAPEVSVQLSQPLESGLSIIRTDYPDASAGYPPLKGTSGGCFIATAAYGSYSAPEVLALRAFRDRYLQTTKPGRLLVREYYHYSPWAAALLNAHPLFKPAVRAALMPVVGAALFLTETSLLVKMAVFLLGCAVGIVLVRRRRWRMGGNVSA